MKKLTIAPAAIPAALMLLGLLFSTMFIQAQSRTITGNVISSAGEPVAGVTVTVKNTSRATTTNESGTYSIQVNNNNSVLVFSHVNYTSQEMPVGSNSSVYAFLEPVAGNLNEVVVVGYGSVRKGDLTGSVVKLKAGDMTPGANISVEQTLMGRAPGVQVYQKSGEPGSAMSVKIRGVSSISGSNDPLYVVDGMPVNNLPPVSGNGTGFPNNQNPRNPLNGLNPSDIESIEILKDASATAIYGSRGSNGVVLITTKRGAQGKLKIGYDGYYGLQKVANSLDLLSGEDYKNVLNAIIEEGGGVASEKVVNEVVNTDWQQELYQEAPMQSHNLTFSGGKDNTRFYASLGYFDQEGVIKKSGVQRYTAKVNLESSVAKKYVFGLNLNTSYLKDKYNSVGIGVNENGSALYSAIYYDPTYPVYDANGDFFRSPFMTTMDHPLALIEGQYANSDGYRTFGNVYGEYFLFPSLSVKLRVGGDINTTQRNTWIDPITIAGLQAKGIATINTGTTTYYMGEATLNYNNEFGKHHRLNAVLGTTYDRYGSNSFGGNARGFSLPDLTFNAIGTGIPTLNQLGSGRASTKIISYLGRANYTFKDKYLVTFTFRADGSSRFGPNNRFAYFPAAAIAWKMQEEKFLEDVSFLDELKLRVSYGSVGNQNIANYLYFSTFSAGADAIFGNVRYNSIAPTRISNPDLQWEGARQADAGIDFSLWRRRLSGSVEYYIRNTDRLLLALPQPLSTGFNTKTVNIGDMKNQGVDLMLAGDVIRSKNFNWNVSGNISILKNEVKSLGPLKQIFAGGAGFIANATIIKPGESLGSYYGYQVLGVWQTNDDFSKAPVGVKAGDLKFLDLDQNKIINADDRVILGKAIPDYNYGFNTTLDYKGFSVGLFFEGSKGAKVLNNAALDSYFPVSFRRNRLAEPYLNRWTPKNPTNEYPSFVNPTSQGQQTINSRTVENASYLRMQSARVAYNIPIRSKAIRSLQAYVTGQNLFTITGYSGVDPAVNAIGSDVIKIDYSTYPMTRSVLFGLNAQF